MEAQDTILIIGAITVSLTTVLSALFAGWVALKQIPQVHKLVNTNYTEQKVEIQQLQTKLEEMRSAAMATAAIALAKSEGREAHSPPPGFAANPTQVEVVNPTPVPVEVVNPALPVEVKNPVVPVEIVEPPA